MADPYPSVAQRIGTQKDSTYSTTMDRAESGKPRLRTFHSQAWAIFRVVHECSKAEMQSILNHYNASRGQSFSFTYTADGEVYTVRYAALPTSRVIEGDFMWVVESLLLQV